MKSLFTMLLLITVWCPPLMSQGNPGIDPDVFTGKDTGADQKSVKSKLKKAEDRYKRGFYEGSFRSYHDLYKINDEVPALNYKLGISALYGDNASEAAGFLSESVPGVTDDYYLQLGYAFQAVFEYSRAKDAFKKYFDSLSDLMQKRFRVRYEQLLEECEFGEAHANDSVPAFVENLGRGVNSYYHEYGAVENSRHERIFYTTRRPENLSEQREGRAEFEERIFLAAYEKGEASEGEEVSRLNRGPHSAVSGISPDEDILYTYHGKERNGQVRVSNISGKKVEKPRRIDRRIDKKISQETSLTETAEGEVFFISDRRKGEGGKDIWTADHKSRGRFTRPRNLGADINTPLDEEAVYVTRDGQTLYFSSNGHPGFGGYDIYKVERSEDGAWGAPENMGQPVNSPQDDLFYFPASDTTEAFIASSRPGGHGGLDLYRIRDDLRIPFSVSGRVTDQNTGDALHAKVSLIDILQKEEVASAYADSVSGEYLIALEDTGSYILQAKADDYKMKTVDAGIPAERNAVLTHDFALEKLKNPYKLFGNIFDEDSGEPIRAEICFKPADKDSIAHRIFSDREDGSYSITFQDKSNMEMTVQAKNYHEHTEELMLANTHGDQEEMNIELEKSLTEYTLSGKVVEEETNDPVPAEIAVFGAAEEESAKVIYADSVSGRYSINVYDRGPFLVEVNADGYFFTNFSLEFDPGNTMKVENVEMRPMTEGASIVAENILFTTGKATLRSESYQELDQLVRLLKENPSVRIEVSGHTDNTGSASLNKRLSKERALSVKRYLESEGIDPDRIEYEGYGFDRPIATNDTSEGRAKNRRVEIEVIE
ncbi:MAG: OmpA family protein [Marinilabilia sp.]